MSDQPADAFTILRGLGFNPTAQGLDRAVEGLARRLANYERALAETHEALRDAERDGAAHALRVEAMRGMEAVEKAKQRPGPFRDFTVSLMKGLAEELARRAEAIESGEVTL